MILKGKTHGSWAPEHPDKHHLPSDPKVQVIGMISPAKVIQIAREVADTYKYYNVFLNNCQNFAKELRNKLAEAMTQVEQPSQPDEDLTARGVSAASGAAVSTIVGVLYAGSAISRNRTQDDDYDE